MGKSRSVSAIIMYLINYHNMTYEESLEHIKKTRPIAKPNSSYIKQLIEYQRKKSKEA
jgi:protein-tyrosine phosphatase